MKKNRQRLLGSALFVLLLVPTGPALSEPLQDSIELAAVLGSLLSDEGEIATAFSWAWGSAPNDPIEWQHNGIKEAPKADQQQHGFYQRRGNVVVTIDGKPTHEVLAEKVHPGRFSVTLRGPRAGWTSVVIESDVTAPELCSVRLESLGDGLSFEKTRCKNEPASAGTPVYAVRKAGKKPAWIRNEYSAGSAGCSQTYEIIFVQDKADAVQCWGED